MIKSCILIPLIKCAALAASECLQVRFVFIIYLLSLRANKNGHQSSTVMLCNDQCPQAFRLGPTYVSLADYKNHK